MAYTQELISELEQLYPEQSEMIQLAKDGDPYLLMYLKNATEEISHTEILNSISLSSLQDKARVIQRKNDLYSLCIDQNYN